MADKDLRLEIEQLVNSNCRLSSNVQELRLEIAYYKGEKKRMEWEKQVLEKELTRQSAKFKQWRGEHEIVEAKIPKKFADKPNILTTMIRTPPKSIDSVLGLSDEMVMLVSCDNPFSIEYCNKAWSDECLYDPHEMHGQTCKILQGEETDKKAVSRFTKDVVANGFGNMRVVNYKKNGEMFNGTVTAYPVFDSVSCGDSGDTVVMTHYASVLSNVLKIPDYNSSTTIAGVRKMLRREEDTSERPTGTSSSTRPSATTSSVDQVEIINIVSELNEYVNQNLEDLMGAGTERENDERFPSERHENNDGSDELLSAMSEAENITSGVPDSSISPRAYERVVDLGSRHEELLTPSVSPSRKRPLSAIDESSVPDSETGVDLGCEMKRKENTVLSNYYKITMENWIHLAIDVRLSDLLRYMVTFDLPLVLTDKSFRILHVNAPWFATYGYSLTEVEGKTINVLKGDLTDQAAVSASHSTASAGMMSDVSTQLYSKDRKSAMARMVVIPIYGGYNNSDVTHYSFAFEVLANHT